MRKKLCVLLLGVCLALLSACGNNIVPNNSNNLITSDDEIDTVVDIKAEPESKQESDQNELDLEELKLMVPDAAEYFTESSEVVSDSYVNFEGTAYCVFRVYDSWNDDEWNSYKQAVIDAGFSNIRYDTDENFSAWTEDNRFYFSFSTGEDQDRKCIYINASRNKDSHNDTQSSNEKSNDAASVEMNNEDSNVDIELVDGMRPEFKEAMDSYEAFYDEYCDIMKKYTENPSDMELLTSYTDMLTKATEMTEKFEAWESDEMNDTELKYYLDVNNRVTKKLLDVSK